MKEPMDTATSTMLEQLQHFANQAQATDACGRCNGLLVVDDCLDILGDAGEIDCRVLRCVQCGDITDPVILRNRTQPPALGPKKFVKWSSAKLSTAARR